MDTTNSFPLLLDLLGAQDDYPGFCRWVDKCLVGPGLIKLKSELKAIVEPSTVQGTLADILGDDLPQVLSKGLVALPPERLARLLAQPELLEDLGETVLLAAAPYWDQLAAEVNPPHPARPKLADLMAEAERNVGTAAVAPPTASPARPQNASSTPTVTAAPQRSGPAPGSSPTRRAWWPMVAAGVALAMLWWWPSGGVKGWQRSEVWTADVSAADYLRRFAKTAEEYSLPEQPTPRQIEEELTAMLAGCDRLLAAEHTPLAVADRDWLRERCETWKKGFVAQRETLRADPGKRNEVRQEFLETVARLRNKLVERAGEIDARQTG